MSKFAPDHIDVTLGKSRMEITRASIEKNPNSRRLAVRMRCLQCVHYDDDPNGEDRIRNCRAYVCGLWNIRPYKNDDAGKRPEATGRKFDPIQIAWDNPSSYPRAVKAYCWHCMGNGRNPGTQRLIHACGIDSCAIHPHRPYQSDAFSAEIAENPEAEPLDDDPEEASTAKIAGMGV